MDAEHRKTQREDFDRWLDLALRARVDAEPRTGLEERVLAHIAAEPARSFSWWAAAAAAVVVFVIAFAIIALYSGKQHAIARNRQSPSLERVRPPEPSGHASAPTVAATVQRHREVRRAACCVSARAAGHASAAAEPAPRLMTFPSLRPQTPQERMLARLAARRGAYEVANINGDQPLKDLSIPELNIEPMEGTPPDNGPQE